MAQHWKDVFRGEKLTIERIIQHLFSQVRDPSICRYLISRLRNFLPCELSAHIPALVAVYFIGKNPDLKEFLLAFTTKHQALFLKVYWLLTAFGCDQDLTTGLACELLE